MPSVYICMCGFIEAKILFHRAVTCSTLTSLLDREVTAADAAQAFHAQALTLATDVTTVDGGNIAAALR
jgi:hypothetical protein